MLSYATDWMTREQIVAATYEVGRGLNDLKGEVGLIDALTHDTVEEHLSSAVRTLAAVVALRDVPESERRRQLLLL